MSPKKSDREARVARGRLRAYRARQTVHETRVRRRRRDNIIAGVGVLVIAVIAVGVQLLYFGVGPGKPPVVPSASPSATPSVSATATPTATPTGKDSGPVPSKTIAKGEDWSGVLTLNKSIRLGVVLDGKAAPQAVSSTLSLIKSGFYDGTVCHRLTTPTASGSTTAAFDVLQCGGSKSLTTAATGGPGYSYGPIENAPKNNVYPTGTIAMARQGDNAYSNGSQFFIVYGTTTIPADTAGGYTVVGRVTSGLPTLIADVTSKGTADGSSDGEPKVPTTITSFTIK